MLFRCADLLHCEAAPGFEQLGSVEVRDKWGEQSTPYLAVDRPSVCTLRVISDWFCNREVCGACASCRRRVKLRRDFPSETERWQNLSGFLVSNG